MEYITVALAKGRLADTAVDYFEKIGSDMSDIRNKGRKLIFKDDNLALKFVLVKAGDVPTYVEHGAADIGIVGKDTLLEENRNLYEMLDLKFGACKMAVAGPEKICDSWKSITDLRVASKYPEIAKEYFENVKGQKIETIKLSGSVELAPLVGLSDVIVDIVESGKTLVANNLCVFEDVCPLSARLVVNRISIKVHRQRIMDIVQKFSEEINK